MNIISPENQNPVFACAATAFGFKSLFSEIFRPEQYNRAYILKGSCGSGKSSLISKVAQICCSENLPCELFACSSDPSSYDGIIIPDKKIYIVDGTSPHITDPLYPGAAEVVIDTSTGLDEKSIKDHRDTIIDLCKKSSAGFSRAYSFLRAAYEMDKGICELSSEHFNHGKMMSAIRRFSKATIPAGHGCITKRRLTRVYCKDGLYESRAFIKNAEKNCIVTDKYGTSRIFMEAMVQEAVRKSQPVTVSLSPLDFKTITEIYLPEISMSFTVCDPKDTSRTPFRIFNMARFEDKNSIRESIQKIRFMKKCFSGLTDGAVQSLKNAYDCHSALEKIYSGSTDYSANDIAAQNLISEIFCSAK
ncbi:MAG: hypothetical protein IJO74_04790 [Clostridia bacterium]|nr:hypothetical protein [Clostridia bacterium]